MQDPPLLTKVDASTPRTQTPPPVSPIPSVLLERVKPRLRVLSLTFVALFVFAWLLPALLGGRLTEELTSLDDWVPATSIIVSSLIVYVLSRGDRVTAPVMIRVGLVYQVTVSVALAFIHYWGAFRGAEAADINFDRTGMTTVAIWMFLFAVVVPNRPSHSLPALLLSGLVMPSAYVLSVAAGDAPALSAYRFFFTLVFPYLIVAGCAFFASSVIYRMGTELRRAQEMGSYRLEERLGRGGMGEVWRAQHSMLARPAAVKLIRRDAFGGDSRSMADAMERFEREAQATAALQSEHTVKLYDFGISDDGTLFYVMELLDGIDLDTLVARFGPLDPARVVHILTQVCLSLEEAHSRGLIHRDIKPANIYICRHALAYDFVKVLDFGLVKRQIAFDGQDQTSITQRGMMAGTPAFMAPEIATGRYDVDGRADIYSLGCTAYWLLTGRPVFVEDTSMATIAAHVKESPTPPSRRAETSVPGPLETLIMTCLAKDPVDRPRTAMEVGSRLAHIELSRPWTQANAARWWEIHQPTMIP